MSLWTLTDVAVRTTAFLGIAAVLAILLRQRAAGLRHLVWAFGLGGALVMPLAVLLIPPAPISVPRVLADALPILAMGSGAAGSGAVSTAGGAIGAGQAGLPDGFPGERPSIAGAESAARHATAAEPTASGPVPNPAPIASSGPGRATAAPPTAARAPAVPGSGLLALWGLGAAAFGAWVLAGAWSTRRLARDATEVTSPAWLDALREVRRDLGIRRPVRLLRGDHAVMPMTWGWRRPVVLVPAAALGWSSERRSVVLRHELAHVKRGDAVTRLLARWTCAVYWFNPMVWFAAYRLRVEGERACDDAVLRLGTRASDYAGHLLGISRDHSALLLRAPAAVAMARPSQLEGRLRAILDPGTRRAARRSTAVLAAAVLAGAALAVSAVAPATQNGAPPPAPVPSSAQEPAAEADTEPVEPRAEPVLELRVPEGGSVGDGGEAGSDTAVLELRADRVDLRRPAGTAEEPGDTVLELRGNVVVAGRAFDLRLRQERGDNADGDTRVQAVTIEPQRNDGEAGAAQGTAAASAPATTQSPTTDERASRLRRAAEEMAAVAASMSREQARTGSEESRLRRAAEEMAAVAASMSREQTRAGSEESRLRRAAEEMAAVAASMSREQARAGSEKMRPQTAPQPPTVDESEAEIRRRTLESMAEALAAIEEMRGQASTISAPFIRHILQSLSTLRALRELHELRQGGRELDPRLIDTFIAALGDTDAEVREQAARGLGRNRVLQAAEPLRRALRDDNAAVRERAAWAIGRIGDGEAVGALLGVLGDDAEPEVRARAAATLGVLASHAAVDGLMDAQDDPDARVRERTAWALGRIGRIRDRGDFGFAVDRWEVDALEGIIEGLRRMGVDLTLDALIRLMDVADPAVRRAAIAELNGGRWPSPGETAETPRTPVPGETSPPR